MSKKNKIAKLKQNLDCLKEQRASLFVNGWTKADEDLFRQLYYSIPELERQICRETGSQYAEKFQWKARWTKASRFQAEFSPGVICAVEYTAEAQDQVETPKLNRILFGGAVSLSCDYYNDELIESHPLFGAVECSPKPDPDGMRV